MSGSAPLVLSCAVRTEDEFQFHLGRDAPKPDLPPSRHLSIVSRRAFGVCPLDDATKAVNALQFETHLADAPALSHLTVRGEGARYMIIHAVDNNLIVLGSCFPTCDSSVYLVYDAVDQSITMITAHPWSLIPEDQPGVEPHIAEATSVLIARSPGGDYALVIMTQMDTYSGYYEPVQSQDVLYVWRSSSRQWDLIRAIFPSEFKGDNVANSYTAVRAFACGGQTFWADLLRGVMYCPVDAMLSAKRRGCSKLKFGFTNLPVEQPCPILCEMDLDVDMCRTIGRSGQSSIKFVTIDGFVQLLDFVECSIKVWSLSPDDSMKRWTRCFFLSLGNLTEQAEFKKAGLPTDMVPMYPSLNAEEEDVVYFMLGKYKKCCRVHKGSKNRCNGYIPTAKNPMYHLRVDMRRGVLLASARLPDVISPSVSLASTSVVPSSMIQRGSRTRLGMAIMDKKDKRRRGDANCKETDVLSASEV